MSWFDWFMQRRKSDEIKLLHGPLQRDKKFLDQHKEWLETVAPNMFHWIMRNYEDAVRKPINEASVSDDLIIFRSGPAVGLLIVTKGWSLADWQHMLDELKNRIKKVEHYIETHADIKQKLIPAGIETVERYALKPDIRTAFQEDGSFKVNQMFGGVRLDLTYLNKNPVQLRIILDRVVDRNYSEALPFEWLFQNLFKQP
ncbi:MAG: hypothetical protein GXO48_06175 [Chlorobi bacterium]|nr:hypothetical protein [Chlorobiota bacterium]